MFIFLRVFIIFLYIFTIYTSVIKCYNVKSINMYRKLTIEDDKLCSQLTKRKIELKFKDYQSLIVTQTSSKMHSVDWQNNWNCKFTVDASHAGLFAVIQKINFRKDPDGECIDYVRFHNANGKSSKKICGNYPHGDIPEKVRLMDLEEMVSFDGKIDTEVFINKESLRSDETMDIMIVYTAFKSCSNHYTSPYSCKEESGKFCINETFFNDSIANCPFEFNCRDEGSCATFETDFDTTLNTDDSSMVTKVVLSAVTSLFITFVCVIVVIWLFRKMGSACCLSLNIGGEQNERSSSSRTQSRVIEMQNRNENDVTITNVAPPTAPDYDKDLPPSYESLFPQPQR